jgi:hypothetical protein
LELLESEDIDPAVLLKAIAEVYDRTEYPRQTRSESDVTVERRDIAGQARSLAEMIEAERLKIQARQTKVVRADEA